MNDQSEAPRVWANQGEAITCINGHAICEMARTVYVGEPRSGAHFTNWQQPEPDRSMPVPELRCKQCRSVWIKGNTKEGYQFHFGVPPHGEWR